MKEVIIFTDGACSPNPGRGGWACVLMYKENRKEISGYVSSSTNNRMELQAAIEGLRALKEPCRVTITTDSEYVYKGITEWIKVWEVKYFKGVKNRDLWEDLLRETKRHIIQWRWVKGHSGNALNERCDELAVAAIRSI